MGQTHTVTLNTFALESSVLMLLNISLSNITRRQSEDALKQRWERRRQNEKDGRERTSETRRGEQSVWAMPFSGVSPFQVCLLLCVKPWEELSCIMQLHVTGRWRAGQPYHPVVPQFIKGGLLMRDTLHCAGVAIVSSETDGGCGQSHFVFWHVNILYAVRHQRASSQSYQDRLVEWKEALMSAVTGHCKAGRTELITLCLGIDNYDF